MSTGLGREEIRALLDDLSAELAARGARAELFLVGGAALAVAYDATRATRDLDAGFIPTGIVRQAATAVAEHRGLTEDWLNDAVKGFLPGPGPDAQRFYSSDSLIVDVTSPRWGGWVLVGGGLWLRVGGGECGVCEGGVCAGWSVLGGGCVCGGVGWGGRGVEVGVSPVFLRNRAS